jgi:hypothetical protein
LTHFFQQADNGDTLPESDSRLVPCSRKVRIGGGLEGRARHSRSLRLATDTHWMKGGFVIQADKQLQIYGTPFHATLNIYFSETAVQSSLVATHS